MPNNFTTRASTRQERSRQWCSLTHAHHVEFEDDREASLRSGEFGPLRLFIVSMGRHRVVQSAGPDNGRCGPMLKFLFQEDGSASIQQGGRTNQIHAGQWCALRKDIPFTLDAPKASRQLAITMPCTMLAGPARGIDWWRKPRSFLRGPAQILHASASASVLTCSSLKPSDCEQLGRQLAALAQMTISVDDSAAAPDMRESRRLAILAFIDRHLGDPALDVARIGREFSISNRTIHKLFEGESLTVVRAIWDRRLEQCRKEMVDPAMMARSITEIAHYWAFSDSQHFSRAFKQRFGITPRDYRNLFILH
jgi:AraC-like DNA-binding protein